MDNKEIIRILKLTASLLELYGENPYKVRSYQTAVYNLDRTNLELCTLDEKQLAELPGVGKSIASTINEINQSGSSSALDNLLKQTPRGIMELIKLKGLGARKIKTAWDQLGIESPAELLAAAEKGRLADLPGFGKKTQDKVLQILSYHQSTKNLILYRDGHLAGLKLEQQIKQQFPDHRFSRTGAFGRKAELISSLQYLWATDQINQAEEFLLQHQDLVTDRQHSGPLRWVGTFSDTSLKLDVRFCTPQEFGSKLVYYTGSARHLLITNDQGICLRDLIHQKYSEESALYKELGWPLIIPELREGLYEKDFLQPQKIEQILTVADLRGILHNHSTYSDGKNSLGEMAKACKDMGYEYFGISDHSQTAVYANGLDRERVLEQHREIDRLNCELAPFKIFKGIESDILNDGNLDYPDSVLQTFDFIVASIHFNIAMDADQATTRLIKAIENPYTTMLGHPTGRQLLRREGYPIHHKKVIDACAEHNVVIELNAHPWRLDLEWQWVRYAVDRGVMISINPDAHEKEGLKDVFYGVSVARKAGLPKKMTFNTLSVEEMNSYLTKRRNEVKASMEA